MQDRESIFVKKVLILLVFEVTVNDNYFKGKLNEKCWLIDVSDLMFFMILISAYINYAHGLKIRGVERGVFDTRLMVLNLLDFYYNETRLM